MGNWIAIGLRVDEMRKPEAHKPNVYCIFTFSFIDSALVVCDHYFVVKISVIGCVEGEWLISFTRCW